MKPRPWFLSLAALWNDDAKAAQHLDAALARLRTTPLFPYHHMEVASHSRHLTVFAILRINALPSSTESFRDFSSYLISSLTADFQILNRLTELFGAGLSLDAYELRVFDSGTAIQFQGGKQLAAFRDGAREVLDEPVMGLARAYGEGIIDPLVEDHAKSRGSHAFGSIARSPNRVDGPIERFRVALQPPVRFQFARIHLLTSDDALTNPRIHGAEDFIIGK